jgi:hypothetical protein
MSFLSRWTVNFLNGLSYLIPHTSWDKAAVVKGLTVRDTIKGRLGNPIRCSRFRDVVFYTLVKLFTGYTNMQFDCQIVLCNQKLFNAIHAHCALSPGLLRLEHSIAITYQSPW